MGAKQKRRDWTVVETVSIRALCQVRKGGRYPSLRRPWHRRFPRETPRGLFSRSRPFALCLPQSVSHQVRQDGISISLGVSFPICFCNSSEAPLFLLTGILSGRLSF